MPDYSPQGDYEAERQGYKLSLQATSVPTIHLQRLHIRYALVFYHWRQQFQRAVRSAEAHDTANALCGAFRRHCGGPCRSG